MKILKRSEQFCKFAGMEGHVLIAHPLLNDGFFNRSVICVTNHSEEGALGFILNFKTQFKLRDVRPQIKNGNFPIYEGGPVAKDQLFFLHTLGNNISETVHVADNIFFGGDFQEMLHLIEHGKVKSHEVRFFAGYSGWGLEQLNHELESGNWLINKDLTGEVFLWDAEDLWKQQLTEIKQSYGIFANIGFDPSMN
ncbi:MAG: transcriptional regulator [Bacteroidetes bacterium]|nr:transcriptional regulator [Bacteroidota bacterium]